MSLSREEIETAVTNLLVRFENIIIDSHGTGPVRLSDHDDSEYKVWQELVELVERGEEGDRLQ